MAALDKGRIRRGGGGLDTRGLVHKAPDGHGVDARIRALVDYLEYIVGADTGQGDLQATRTPTAADGHLAAGKRYLVAGNGNGFQNRTTNLALGTLIQKSEVIVALHRNRPPSAPRHDS